jgi:hypothetical protein
MAEPMKCSYNVKPDPEKDELKPCANLAAWEVRLHGAEDDPHTDVVLCTPCATLALNRAPSLLDGDIPLVQT